MKLNPGQAFQSKNGIFRNATNRPILINISTISKLTLCKTELLEIGDYVINDKSKNIAIVVENLSYHIKVRRVDDKIIARWDHKNTRLLIPIEIAQYRMKIKK